MSDAMSSSNHIGTTIPPLADTITGFNSRTLKSCPFCGHIWPELVLFDEEGYVITEEVWVAESGTYIRKDKGLPYIEDTIQWAQKHYEVYVDHYGIECSECGAIVYGQSPDEAKEKWNRRAYPIREWRSAFSPTEGIQ